MEVILFDIEASCDDKNKNPNYNMETIEIGAVKVNNEKITDKFQTFVKPQYIQELTAFCIELTGITYEDLEYAPEFNEAILEFYSFAHKSPIYSCGNFDRNFLIREIDEKKTQQTHEVVKNFIRSSHINFKEYYNQITGLGEKEIIPMTKDLNIKPTGRLHRGLDDAINLAKIYIEIERIRRDKLTSVFQGEDLKDVIYNLNKQHNKRFTIKDETIIDEELMSQMDALEFLDKWKRVIITDHQVRKVNYLSEENLEKITQYTK